MKVGKEIKAGDDARNVAAPLLYLLAGPLVWAGHLFLVYAPQSVLCASLLTGLAGIDPLLIEILVGVVTALAAAALGFAMWLPRDTARLFRAAPYLDGENGAFMITVMRLLAALSLAGVLWAGAGVLLLQACPQLR